MFHTQRDTLKADTNSKTPAMKTGPFSGVPLVRTPGAPRITSQAGVFGEVDSNIELDSVKGKADNSTNEGFETIDLGLSAWNWDNRQSRSAWSSRQDEPDLERNGKKQHKATRTVCKIVWIFLLLAAMGVGVYLIATHAITTLDGTDEEKLEP